MYKNKDETILAFNFDVGEPISTTTEVDFDDNGYIPIKAVNNL